MTQNAVGGHNAAQFSVAKQDNLTHRIVALRVFGSVVGSRLLVDLQEIIFRYACLCKYRA